MKHSLSKRKTEREFGSYKYEIVNDTIAMNERRINGDGWLFMVYI